MKICLYRKTSPRQQNYRESGILSFCGGKKRNREIEKGEKEDDHEEEEGEVRKFNFSEIGYIHYKETENCTSLSDKLSNI